MWAWILGFLLLASPAWADYMATGFATNGIPVFATGKSLSVESPATVLTSNDLPKHSIPFSVSGDLLIKSIDCVSDPSAWTTDDYLEFEVYTHTTSTGVAGTASGVVLRVTADTTNDVELFHYSGSAVTVSESSGSLSLKVVDSTVTGGTAQIQCSIRYEGA